MTELDRNTLLDQAGALRERGEARAAIELLVPYAEANHDDGEVALMIAELCDSSGRTREAVPHYERALASDLPIEDFIEASIGLGSSLRALGEYEQSIAILDAAHAKRPDNRVVETFLAMAQFNAGHQQKAFETLLRILSEASANQDIRAYSGALTFYAEDIAATWE